MLDMGELARSVEAMEHLRQQAMEEGVSEEEIDKAFGSAILLVFTGGFVFSILVLIVLVVLNIAGVGIS